MTALSQNNFTPPPTTQQASQIAESPIFITLNVIVTDRNGHYVEGLSPDQFEIYDNNVKQEITHFSTDDSAASFGIVYEIDENDTEQLSGSFAQDSGRLPKPMPRPPEIRVEIPA